MTEFMQHGRKQNEPGNNEDTRNHPRATAVHFHQQQEEQQDHKSQMNADFSSAKPCREY
jgi:hypothetical protein